MFKLKAKTLGCVLVILLCWAVPVQAADTEVFNEVQNLIAEYYVDPVDVYHLPADNARDLIKALNDPHSVYFTAEEYEQFMGSIDREYIGIGIYIDSIPVNEGIKILGIIPNSPAQKAGLQSEDIITRIDTENIAGMTLEEAYQLLSGAAGSRVDLDIIRNTGIYHFQLIREAISEPSVLGEMLDFNTGYIDIDSFSIDAAPEMNEEIVDLHDSGADKWIIDLQSNPGGHLEAAQSIGGFFLGSSPMITVQQGGLQDYLYSVGQSTNLAGPAIVLIDGDSASASEVLAAALKDYRRAVIIGEQSYGKGSIQRIYPLSNGDWVKLTIARFASPLGNRIDGAGIEPDINVEDIHARQAAELLLADPKENKDGSFSFLASGYQFIVDLDLIRDPLYWAAWQDIVDDSVQLPVFNPVNHCESEVLTRQQVEQKWPLYYPGAHRIGQTDIDTANPEFYLYISGNGGWQNLNDMAPECRDSETGARIGIELQAVDEHLLAVHMQGELKPGEYWMLFGTPEWEHDYLIQIFAHE